MQRLVAVCTGGGATAPGLHNPTSVVVALQETEQKIAEVLAWTPTWPDVFDAVITKSVDAMLPWCVPLSAVGVPCWPRRHNQE
jgi:hypothetical protein